MASSIEALAARLVKQAEQKIAAELPVALQRAADKATQNFASLYSGKSSQLSSTGAYTQTVTCSKTSGSIVVTPNASPQPSVFGQPTIAGSHSMMLEQGLYMDLKGYFASGGTQKPKQPARPTREAAQAYLNSEVQAAVRKIVASIEG